MLIKPTDEQIIDVADQHLYKGYLVFAKEIIDEFCRINGLSGEGRLVAATEPNNDKVRGAA